MSPSLNEEDISMNKKHLVIIIEDDFDMHNMFKMVAELVPDYDIEVITDGAEAINRIDNIPSSRLLFCWIFIYPMLKEMSSCAWPAQTQAGKIYPSTSLPQMRNWRRVTRGTRAVRMAFI